MAVDLNFFRPTDESESYVYVQTFNDINEITGRSTIWRRKTRDNYHLRGMILCDSTYPLPWLLGDFTRIGYYSRGNKPPDFHADFLLVTEKRVAEAEAGWTTDYFKQTSGCAPRWSRKRFTWRVACSNTSCPSGSRSSIPARGRARRGRRSEAATAEAEPRMDKSTCK